MRSPSTNTNGSRSNIQVLSSTLGRPQPATVTVPQVPAYPVEDDDPRAATDTPHTDDLMNDDHFSHDDERVLPTNGLIQQSYPRPMLPPPLPPIQPRTGIPDVPASTASEHDNTREGSMASELPPSGPPTARDPVRPVYYPRRHSTTPPPPPASSSSPAAKPVLPASVPIVPAPHQGPHSTEEEEEEEDVEVEEEANSVFSEPEQRAPPPPQAQRPTLPMPPTTTSAPAGMAAAPSPLGRPPLSASTRPSVNASVNTPHQRHSLPAVSTPGAAASPITGGAGATPNRDSAINNNQSTTTSQPAQPPSSATKTRGRPLVRRTSSIANSVSDVSITSSGHVRESAASKAKKKKQAQAQQDGAGEAEELIAIPTRQPLEKFFVQYTERQLKANADADSTDGGANATNVARDEDELLLEQFAEYTDDDTFFSSGSTVIETDPQRMVADPSRARAVKSVHDTLELRSLTGGRVPQDDEWNSASRTKWIYQIHYRDLALQHSSFFVFPAKWMPRVVVYNVMHHWLMEMFIFLIIFGYSIFQATWARYTAPRNMMKKPDHMIFADVFYTVLLGFEVLARLFASGFILHERAFLRSPWHWLDVACLVLQIMACTWWQYLWNFTSWRLIRCIKCLSYIPVPVRMKLLAKSLLRSTNRLMNVCFLILYFVFFFGLIGLQLFGGEMHSRCVNSISGTVTDQICRPSSSGHQWFYWGHRCAAPYTCVVDQFPNKHFDFSSFDDIGHAMLSAFQIMTFQGWTSLMNETNDALTVMAFLYYAITILICTWIIPSLFLGVFVEKIEKTSRLYVLRQLGFFDEMLKEQRQRLSANVRLSDFVERDEDGHVPRYPSAYHKVSKHDDGEGSGSSAAHMDGEGGISDSFSSDAGERKKAGSSQSARHASVGAMQWTDEQRIQLQLSLTRQFSVAEDAERKRVMQKSNVTEQILYAGDEQQQQQQQQQRKRRQGGKKKAQTSEEARAPPQQRPAAAAKPTQFALGGRVGEVQHHPASYTIGASKSNDMPFAMRQELFQAENLRFLDPYNNSNNNNGGNLNNSYTFGPGASQNLAPASAVNNSRVSASRAGPGASMTSVMATREVAGVVPSTAAMTSTMPLSRMNSTMTNGGAGGPANTTAAGGQMSRTASQRGGSAMRPASASAVAMPPAALHSDEQLELVVHDPEGGDFDYADGCGEKFGIIRNICHMFTEGYPRIITQYLWEHRIMQWRYGLGPLTYTNKYEEAALRKLRARRAHEREEEREDMRRHGQAVQEDEMDLDDLERAHYGATTRWMQEEGLVAGGMAPLRMARNIRENAPITVFNYIMYFLILANAVFNASRFDTMPDYWEMGTFVAGVCFSVLFMLELLIRMVALGPGPFFFDFFNVIEIVFMVISLFQLGFSRANTISLFNWVRFLKLFRVVPIRPLRRVTRVLIHGFPDMLYALLFFSLYMFMWVLIGMSFFGSRMGWIEYPETSEEFTRGTFVSFSHAVYAVAQAFSVNRDQWRLLSWQGMRVRGGYTIMYFIATVLVAFIFRYFFIAVMTYSWQSQEEEEDYDFMSSSSAGARAGRRGGGRLRWFDFTVWRSFKHLHGGFDRRDVAPDEVYFINEDMRRQLRLVESKEANFRRLYSQTQNGNNNNFQNDGVVEAGEGGVDALPQYVNVGGQLYRQPTADPTTDSTIAAVAAEKAQLRFARQQRTVPANMPTTNNHHNAHAMDRLNGDSAYARASPSPQYGGVNDSAVFSDQGQRSMINPLVADRHSLSPARNGGAVVVPGREGSAMSQTLNNNNNNNMTTGTYSVAPAPSMSAQLLRLGRQKSGSRRGGAQQTMDVDADIQEDGEAAMVHVLLAGPRLRYKSALDGGRRLFEVCLDCNTHKQMPLRAMGGVRQRSADELHAEHCHMCAVRSARQLVLNALVGYARLQAEHDTTPTKRAMETVLGQAWSCGMLLFETVEHLAGMDLPEPARNWDRLIDALELQQWLLGLHAGEEQVGRATLAYVLANQQKQETKARQTSYKESWQDYTFFCLSPSNPVRKGCTTVVDSWWFEMITLIVIYAASICLAVYTPGDNNRDMGGSYNSGKYKALHVLDDIFTIIFTVEMVFKWVVMGLILPVKKAYFWHLWNIFDFFIVIISLVSWGHANTFLRYLKVMRCFRILKPVRHWQWNRSLSSVALAVWDSIPTLANVCLIMLMNYIVWSIIFVSMFMNKMNVCSDGVTNNRTACLLMSYKWVPADRNFRNFYESLLTTFEISTGAEWMDVMYNAVDSWSTMHFPIRNRHPYLGLVFVAYYYLSHFVLFSLFISAMIYCYLLARNAAQGAVGISFEHQLWLRMQDMIIRIKPKAQLRPLNNGFSRLLHRMVTATWFEVVMAIILVCNMITMALEWYHMDSKQELALNILQWIFVALFTIEVILRLIAHGPRFFSRWAYCWDLFVCILSYIQIGCNTTAAHQVPFNMNVLRMLRFGRVLTLVDLMTPFDTHLRLFHDIIIASVPGFISVTVLYMLAVYIFAILGLHFLGYIVPYGGYIDGTYNNFQTFVNALIMVFRLSTLENWATMLRGSLSRPDSNYCHKANARCGPTNWAPVYYVPIVICFFLMLSTLYMAVVLDQYISAIRLRHSVGRLHDLRRFCTLWAARDPNHTEVLKTSQLVDILEELRPPLGLCNRHNRAELLRLLSDYDIPDHNGRVHYDEVLMPMARRVMAMAFHQAGEEEGDVDASTRAYELAWRLSEQSLGSMAIQSTSEADLVAADDKDAKGKKKKNKKKGATSAKNAVQVGPRHTVAEHYAATYVQAAYKRDRARRNLYAMKTALWRKGRRACDEQAVPYDEFGFGRVGLAYTDPSDEGRALGFYIPGAAGADMNATGASNAANQTVIDRHAPLFARTARRQGLLNDDNDDNNNNNNVYVPSEEGAASDGPRGGPATILPLKYVSAIGQPVERRFGPDVPDAIKRYERRSDKFDRRTTEEDGDNLYDEEDEAHAPSGQSPSVSRTGNNLGGASAFHTDRMDASYQPPLGTNPEVMREEELQRRLDKSVVAGSTPSRVFHDS